MIWEAPDDTVQAQPLLRIAGLGKVRPMTMRAFTESEMGEIVGGLSGGALVCEGGGRPGGWPLWVRLRGCSEVLGGVQGDGDRR